MELKIGFALAKGVPYSDRSYATALIRRTVHHALLHSEHRMTSVTRTLTCVNFVIETEDPEACKEILEGVTRDLKVVDHS